jgi:hypothetical protein
LLSLDYKILFLIKYKNLYYEIVEIENKGCKDKRIDPNKQEF